ncbi:MAG TPA: endo-1,4-beta-xylanase, partial [Pirellulales bacterium]
MACFTAVAARADAPTLKDAYKDDFKIGVALGGTLPDDYTENELAVIKANFNAVTPENCMKPFSLQPEENQWSFAQADALVEFAEANHMQVTGHNLIWHEQTPAWFFDDNGKHASRDKLLERMKTHIQTVVGRYKGRIHGWDVVNEAVAEGGSGDL